MFGVEVKQDGGDCMHSYLAATCRVQEGLSDSRVKLSLMIPVALKTSSSKEMHKRSPWVHLNLSILVSSARQIVDRA